MQNGSARFAASNVVVPDYFNVMNGIVGGGPDPVSATVSFDMEWRGEIERRSLRNSAQSWDGDFVINTATLSWSAENPDGFTFMADPLDVGFAQIGRMRNGRFFS